VQEMQERARENLPTVLLTLLSIVQALALEFLWTYVRDNPGLLEVTWLSALTWVQLATSFLGLVLIWIIYASQVMRLRWVPTTIDSIYPFAIGLLEFVLIELLGPDHIGPWLICYAAIFALMVWISHRTMRRARLDGQNAPFFEGVGPARLRDFTTQVASIGAIGIAGVYVAVTDNSGVPALLGMLVTAALVLYQYRAAESFWDRSLPEMPPQD
jgi:hypothetical protein